MGIEWFLGVQYVGDAVEMLVVELFNWIIWMLVGDFF